MPLLYLNPLPPRTNRGEVLEWLVSAGGIDRKRVGRIDLQGPTAVVEVPDGWESRLAKALDGAEFRTRRLRAWSAPGEARGSDEDHFQRLSRLLDLESRAEAAQAAEKLARLSAHDAERSGLCIADLVIAEESSGLGGRCLLTLVKRNRTLNLPWTRLQSGSPVLLRAEDAAPSSGTRGVVCERCERYLRIAVDEPPDEAEDARLRVELSGDETARIRQQAALERARTAHRDRLAELRDVLGGQAPAFDDEKEFLPLDPTLNASQQSAVRFALTAHDVAILHGPPGTGKTTTVVELIRQAVRRGDRILACAPSNLGVDNLLERLVASGEKVIRLGHPARVLPQLQEHTLDLLVEQHDDVRQARKLTREAFQLFRKAGKWTRAKPVPGARSEMRTEARALLEDARRLEAHAVEQILNGADILCATLTGLDSEVLSRRQFDLAVIDEACQSPEPACWIPLLRCQRVVLAGDHCQLPPTVVSPEAVAQGLGISLMERLVALHGDVITRRLGIQYRMHQHIMEFSSREFYEGDLQADTTVAGHRLCDLPGVQAGQLTETPVEFIDTAGAGYDEELEPDGESRQNPAEARLVVRKVEALLAAGVPAADIGVIAPYAAQVRRLRESLNVPGLEIDSVDGFQGREKEALVVSLVRSNAENDIGFLADVRRMNVALTRARRKLLVIGDSATLAAHPFFHRLFAYFDEIGATRSVWEEME
jgi:superfamily I DNA and/or RNA helicase